MITTTGTLVQKYDSPSKMVSYIFFQVEEVFVFQEGQFVMIETEIDGKVVKRPYSLATTNRLLHEEKQVGIVVKKTSDRGMSDYLTLGIELGDAVQIKGPVGHYTNDKSHPNYLLVSTGSGLSPNVGLFQHLVYESRAYEKIVHLFGERTYDQIVPELEELFTQHGQDSITNLFYLSQEKELPTGYLSGRVQAGLDRAIELLGTHTSCFLCGAPEMVEDVAQKLQALGIPREQITFEKY